LSTKTTAEAPAAKAPPPPPLQQVTQNRPIPPIPRSLPASLHDFIREHYHYSLDDCTGHPDNCRGWDANLKNRFLIHMYLYGKIYDKAMVQTCAGISRKQRLYNASDALDLQRGTHSLKLLYDWYKTRDLSRKKRQRTMRDDNGGNSDEDESSYHTFY
jgi:hypothetical protein